MLFPNIVELAHMVYNAGYPDIDAPVDCKQIVRVTGAKPFGATPERMTMDKTNLGLLGMNNIELKNDPLAYEVVFQQNLDHDPMLGLLAVVGGFCEFSTDYILSEDGRGVEINNMSDCLWNNDWTFQMPHVLVEFKDETI